MDLTKNTVKTRIIRAIGLTTVERPRDLQQPVGTAEHHIVHELYRLSIDGLVQFRASRNKHSSGRNLFNIKLTKRGREALNQLGRHR